MSSFKFDLAYRNSDEYKSWHAAIKADHPDLDDYLIDLAIIRHKLNPMEYKSNASLRRSEPPKKRKAPKEFIDVEGAVQVHESLQDAKSVKIVDA